MLSWKIGQVTVRRVVETEMPVAYHEKHPFLPGARPEALAEMPWLYPHFVTEDGALRLSIHALLVEAPGLRFVVDTCIGNDRPRQITGRQPLSTDFLKSFEASGWSRDSVDAVVCTHLHVDHVGWNTMLVDGQWVPTFPKARYLIGRAEYEHWMAEGDEDQHVILSDSIAPIFEAGLAELVEMDHRLSPEVSLRPTPGHTPGHVSVAIESEGQTALITGDFMHHPSQIARPHWCPSFDSDQAAATATRKAMIAELADAPTLVIGTHFAAPTAGRIVRDGDSHRFEA